MITEIVFAIIITKVIPKADAVIFDGELIDDLSKLKPVQKYLKNATTNQMRWVDTGLKQIFSQLHDTQCYFEEKEVEELPVFGAQNVSTYQIFFVKSACKPSLSLREGCSVESAARAHPCRPINVIFLGPASSKELDGEPIRTLLKYRNINIYRIHIDNLVKGKSISRTLLRRVPLESAYPIYHASEIVRYLILNKYGGIYLDLDVIAMKSLDDLPVVDNWVAIEDIRSHKIGASMMAFSKVGIGKIFTNELLRVIEEDYSPRSYTHNSNGAIKRTLAKICGDGYMQVLNKKSCQGLAIYDQKHFYPINFKTSSDYFRNEYNEELFATSFTLHMYNSLTGERSIRNTSMYAKVMRKFCPWMNRRAAVIKVTKTRKNLTKILSRKELEQKGTKINSAIKVQYL